MCGRCLPCPAGPEGSDRLGFRVEGSVDGCRRDVSGSREP